MFLKNQCKKINRILPSVLIFSLLLFLTPWQTRAAINVIGNYSCDPDKQTCHSCNPEGKCVRDDYGPYSCSQCKGQCSTPATDEVPGTSSGCGSAPITGPIEVIIVGGSPSETAETPLDMYSTILNMANATGMAEETKNMLISAIQKDGKIPEEFKPWLIGAIQDAKNIPENTKKLLIDTIQKDGKIPEEFKSLLIGAIQNYKNVTELIKNKLISLIMEGMDVGWICEGLSNAVTAIPFFGSALSAAIHTACPAILNELLAAFISTIYEKDDIPNIQSVKSPIIDFYQWEIGIPGFTKPGEITPFK